MAFSELRTYHDPDLVLTIDGIEYRVPQPSASAGLRIRQLFAAQAIGDATELDHIAQILGAEWVSDVRDITVMSPITGEPILDESGEPITEAEDMGTYRGGVWQEMDDNGVTWDEIMHAGRTALIDIGMGRVIAQRHWEQGLAPYIADMDEAGGADPNRLPPQPGGNRAARRAATKPAAKKAPAKKAAPKKKAPAKKAVPVPTSPPNSEG